MLKIILSMLLTLTLSSAVEMSAANGGCTLAQQGKVSVTWKAYKTPAKIGVGGTFDSVKYTSIAPSGKNFREIMVGSTVKIDTASVNSSNKGRDETLVKYFFKQMNGSTIIAKIVGIKAGKRERGKPKTGMFTVDITMNGITKTVPMPYSYDKGVMQANGFIDLFDFTASKALRSINKACYDLHSGKTWSDVAIGFSTGIAATLCSSKHIK
ncbi:MAG: YceI family protein [Campylobacterota bacterium]|nr:YceI family protein [Campylobacterota bacterium]